MRKLLFLPLLLLFTGCSLFQTPQAVHDDLALIKDNIVIQKRIADTLLAAIEPQNHKQVEAIALKKLDLEQRFDRMAAAVNRLVTYYKVEQKVGYLINTIQFMQESRLKEMLLSQVEREIYYDQEGIYDREVILNFDDFGYCYVDEWMPDPYASY